MGQKPSNPLWLWGNGPSAFKTQMQIQMSLLTERPQFQTHELAKNAYKHGLEERGAESLNY